MRAKCRRNAAIAASRGIGDCSAASTASASDNCAAAASRAFGMAIGVSMFRIVLVATALFGFSGMGRKERLQSEECIQRLSRCQPVGVDFRDRATQFFVRRGFFLGFIWALRGGEQ